ncbi:hypothetical protein B566_EDAN002076 [Ephemera danica]|nr:hypothetical protein B566_EDAN002076 [Ephemera danica]
MNFPAEIITLIDCLNTSRANIEDVGIDHKAYRLRVVYSAQFETCRDFASINMCNNRSSLLLLLLLVITSSSQNIEPGNDVCQQQQGTESSACACACSSAGTAYQQQPPPSIHIDMSSLLHDAVEREVTAQQDQIIFRLGLGQGQGDAQGKGTYFSRDNLELVKLGDKKYFFSRKQQMSWTDAASFCRLYGMDLISAETREKDLLILQHLRSIGLGNESSGVYTSANKIGSKDFQWAFGQPLNHTNWAPNEPSNPKVEHCVIYWRYAWADFSCTSLAFFACEEN